MILLNKKAILIISLLASALVIYLFFVRNPPGVEVEVSEVVQGNLTSSISAPGVVQPLTEVQISSSVAGTVQKLPVKEGQKVKKGDLLLQIDPTEFRAQVRRALAGLEVAQANQQQARSRWNRARQLYNSKLISEQEYEAARTEHLLSQAQVKEARANLEQASEGLRQTTITSPIKGTVTQINVVLGENVITGTLNTPGTKLMVVADLSNMEVESQVDEADIAKVTMGQRAVIEVEAIPEKNYEGTVHEIGYSADDGETEGNETVNYNVSILIKDSISELKPGMTATSDIITSELKNVLMVPIQSVVTRPVSQLSSTFSNGNGSSPDPNGRRETEAVFVVVNGTAQLVPVTTGVAGEQYIQITDGLQQGQQIITGPFNSLRELQSGERVRNEK